MVKNITTAGAVVIAIIFGVFAFKAPSVVTVPQIQQLQGQSAPIVNVPAPIVNVEAPVVNVAAPKVSVNVPEQTRTNLGAVSSPDLYSPYWGVNGVRDYYARREFDRDTFGVTGTTTPCSFLSPTSTSTLLRASVNITESTTTPAVKWTLATSTTAYATTTRLYQFTAVAGKTHSWEYIATTTTSAGSPLGTGTIPPSTYVNIANEGVISYGSAPRGFRIGGSCQVVFEVL